MDNSLLKDALEEIDTLRKKLSSLDALNSNYKSRWEQCQRFFDFLPIPYIETGKNTQMTYVNKAFANLVGYAADELVGRQLTEFFATERDIALHEYIYPVYTETGAITNVHWRLKTADNGMVSVVMHARAHHSRENDFVSGQGIFVKVSESNYLINNIDVVGVLSPRELEVFEMIGAGARTKQIAEKLKITTKTVENFRENIKRKLKLNSAHEMTTLAIEWVHK